MRRRLANLWRRTPAKMRAQVARFARVFTFTAVPAGIASWHAHHMLLGVLGAAVAAGLETAFRQCVTPPEAAALLRDVADLAVHPAAVTPAAPPQPPPAA